MTNPTDCTHDGAPYVIENIRYCGDCNAPIVATRPGSPRRWSVRFLDNVADVNAPTAAELAAGVDLSGMLTPSPEPVDWREQAADVMRWLAIEQLPAMVVAASQITSETGAYVGVHVFSGDAAEWRPVIAKRFVSHHAEPGPSGNTTCDTNTIRVAGHLVDVLVIFDRA